MPIREAVCRKGVFLSGVLVILSAPFRFSTCYRPPPMVRFYEYSIPQKDVLPQCQKALEALGYEVETYAPLDYHLITKMRTVRRGLRKIRYVVFVKVEDRIGVYVYAETRVFRRGTELGLMAGELTAEEPRRLRLGFQKRIFGPITGEFSRKGFHHWSPQEDNLKDDREIRAREMERLKSVKGKMARKQRAELSRERETRDDYLTGRERARWLAVEEAEQFVRFVDDSLPAGDDTSFATGWSLVEISRRMVPKDRELEEAFLDVLGGYPDYGGSGRFRWVITPQGRVVDVRTELETSPGVPDDELIHAIDIHVRKLFFPPPDSRQTYAVLRREFRFHGNYHNLQVTFDRPELKGLLEHYPPLERETVVDTFFERIRPRPPQEDGPR